MVRTSYEWITKSQCIWNLKRSSVCDITSSCFTRSGITLSHQQKLSVQAHPVMPLNKKKQKPRSQYFSAVWCGFCCSTSSKVFSFQVLCKLPLQMKAANLLYEMLFFFLLFHFLKKIYISFYVFKVNGLNLAFFPAVGASL